MNSKICTKCALDKPLSDYYFGYYRGSARSECKPCGQAIAKERNNRPEEKIRIRNKRILKQYGLSVEGFDSLVLSQNNSCAICFKNQRDLSLGLHIDHCHETKKVRGLLCMDCNTGIGKLKDSIEMLESAKNYLAKG